MDILGDYILVTYRPFDVHIMHVKISGELSPSNTPTIEVIFSFVQKLTLKFFLMVMIW